MHGATRRDLWTGPHYFDIRASMAPIRRSFCWKCVRLSRPREVQHRAHLRSAAQGNSEVVLSSTPAPGPAFSDVEHHRVRRSAALLLE